MDTKQKILHNAQISFSKFGYAATSIRKLARESGIRESGIYNHFSSKSEIFNTILKRIKINIIDKDIFTDELLDKLNNPFDFLTTATKRLIQKWTKKQNTLDLKFLILAQNDDPETDKISLNEIIENSKKIWVLIFSEIMKFNLIKKNQPEEVATQFFEPLFLCRLKFLSEDYSETKFIADVNRHLKIFWQSIKL